MTTLPLANYELGRAHDLEGTRRTLVHGWRQLQIERVGMSERMDFRLHGVPLGNRMSVSALTFGNEVLTDAGPLGLFAILIPLSGQCVVWSGDQKATIGPGRAVVLSSTDSARTRWSSDCAQRIVAFEPEGVERHLSQILGEPLAEPLRFELEMDVTTGRGKDLYDGLLLPLYRRLEVGHRMFDQPGAVANLTATVTSALLAAQPHNYSVWLGLRPESP